jgi:PAS domain S-box-containing protein
VGPRDDSRRAEIRVTDANQKIVDVLIRLSQGDLSARMERTRDRDVNDAIAYSINVLASEFEKLLAEREQNVWYLSVAVNLLSTSFMALAEGNYDVRVPRTNTDDPVDALARMFNETVVKVQKAVLAIEEQRNALEATIEAMLDPVLLLTPNGTIRRGNAAAATLFDVDADALVGTAFSKLTTPEDLPFATGLDERVAREPIRDRETEFEIANGRATLPVSASAYHDSEGHMKGIVVLIRDDRDLRDARAQLQMSDRLTAMGTIAAGVAHEINNPLAFVISNLEFLIEELDETATTVFEDGGKEVRAALAAAHRGSERVRQIVQDLRTFSRADRESFRPVDVNQLIKTAVAMLDNEIRHHASVVLELGEIPDVEANEAKLGQVFLNLIHNAAQAIPPGRASENTIHVTSARDSTGRVVVTIQDSGQGIERRHVDRIFDAFFTTKPAGVGTGLGLAICHQVVAKLGGSISVDSTVGEGATFTVSLPPSQRPSASLEAKVEATSTTRRRILVIDDEIEVGQAVRRILRRRHDVDVVQRADVALEILATAPYDVILCDVMMPEMTGMEFYDRLRAEMPALVDKVLFISGGAFSPEAREFLLTHAGTIVEKPFETRALRSLIDKVVGDG